jgi:hypothetical protein
MYRNRLLTGTLTAAAALLVTVGMAQVGPPTSNCPRVAVTSVEHPADVAVNRFSAVKTTDLVFHVMFSNEVAKDHVVTLNVYTPHGHLYRRLDVPVAPNRGNTPAGTRRLAGYPYPVKVQTPAQRTVGGKSYAVIDVSLPVAGTSIVTSSLYGRWEVAVVMDGARQPCPERTQFYITQ